MHGRSAQVSSNASSLELRVSMVNGHATAAFEVSPFLSALWRVAPC